MGCCTSLYVSRDTFYPLVYVPTKDLDLPQTDLPSCRKKDLINPDGYKSVEKHVEKGLAAGMLYASFHTVAKFLTRPARDDISRLWALYYWVATVDIDKTSDYNPLKPPVTDSPLDLILKIKEKESSHAHLFAALVRALDMDCVIINGITKNADYNLGDTNDKSKMAAQWNAVRLDNEWRLVDTYWGSQCVTGRRFSDWAIVDADGQLITIEEKCADGKCRRNINEFFFLTDPDMFICTHLPEDPAWQLLPVAITEETFFSCVYIREHFFQLGCTIQDESCMNVLLRAVKGEQTIRFRLPKKRSINYDFKYLLFKDKSVCQNVHNKDLKGIVFNESKSDMLSYMIQFPVQGKFRFDIFGADSQTHDAFDLLASYLIECDTPCPHFERLPDSPTIGWGPGIESRRVGLVPITHNCSVIETKDGTVQIRFKMRKQLSFGVQLKHNDLPSWELENNAVVRTERDEMILDVRLPKQGQYAVKIFAKDPDEPGRMENVCNYLVKNQDGSKMQSFPGIYEGSLGKRVNTANHFGVQVLSHIEDILFYKEKSIDIKFSVTRDDVELLANLCGSGLKDDNISTALIFTVEKDQVTFSVNFPCEGEFALNVFARQKQSIMLYSVQTYLIKHWPDGEKSVKAESFGPQFPTEVMSHNGSQVNISHRTDNKESVHCSFEKQLYISKPGALDSSVTTSESSNSVHFTVNTSQKHSYNLDIFEHHPHGSGHILMKKAVRLMGQDLNGDTIEVPVKAEISNELDASFHAEPDPNFNPKTMRVRLKMNLVMRNLEFAEAALARCRNNDFHDPELVPQLEHMVNRLRKDRELNKSVHKAIATGNTVSLERVIDSIEQGGLLGEMGFQLIVARQVLHKRLGERIRKMDQTTVAEVKSYSAPPPAAQQVMKASLLLLGHRDSELKDWESIRHFIGDTQKMKQRLKDVDVDSVDSKTASEAHKLVSQFTRDDVMRTSDVVDCFFAWSRNLIKMKLMS